MFLAIRRRSVGKRACSIFYNTACFSRHYSDQRDNGPGSNNKNNTAILYSSLHSRIDGFSEHPQHQRQNNNDSPFMEYARGWAWQTLLLQRRLEYKRQNQESTATDPDVIFFLEHDPVYTLGRGAKEEYLSFLSPNDDINRHRLSRKQRGPGTARLSLDSTRHRGIVSPYDTDEIMEDLVNQLLSSPTINNDAINCADANNTTMSPLALGVEPVLAPNNVPIYRVERGGEVTYHGPGQLVVYPLLDLQKLNENADLHWYLRKIEQVIIDTLDQEYNIQGYRDDINTGVWVTDDTDTSGIEHRNKIAAVGVSASRWITTHGFALNICPDLNFFDTSIIIPCGIQAEENDDDTQQLVIQRGVTSIADIFEKRGQESEIPTIHQVAQVILKNLENVFGIHIESIKNIR